MRIGLKDIGDDDDCNILVINISLSVFNML